MATIENRGGNKWRISQMYNGKRYRITIESDKKPLQKEARLLIEEEISKAIREGVQQPKNQKLTVRAAAEKYISLKDNSLSPSTIRGYKGYIRSLPEDFSEMLLDTVTEEQLQLLVKRYQAEHSVKYTKNVIMFLKSVFKMFRKNFAFNVTFATEIKEEAYIPSNAELKMIIDKARNTPYEIPIILGAVCGMRRGEILALTPEDLDEDNVAHITKAVVFDNDGNRIVKNCPKTKGSIRAIGVPEGIANKIRKQGYAYSGGSNCINNWLLRTEAELGIKKFTFHKLRHYFCTSLHEAGVPDADIMKLGGWSDPSVMTRIYRHGRNDLDTMQNAMAIASKGIL